MQTVPTYMKRLNEILTASPDELFRMAVDARRGDIDDLSPIEIDAILNTIFEFQSRDEWFPRPDVGIENPGYFILATLADYGATADWMIENGRQIAAMNKLIKYSSSLEVLEKLATASPYRERSMFGRDDERETKARVEVAVQALDKLLDLCPERLDEVLEHRLGDYYNRHVAFKRIDRETALDLLGERCCSDSELTVLAERFADDPEIAPLIYKASYEYTNSAEACMTLAKNTNLEEVALLYAAGFEKKDHNDRVVRKFTFEGPRREIAFRFASNVEVVSVYLGMGRLFDTIACATDIPWVLDGCKKLIEKPVLEKGPEAEQQHAVAWGLAGRKDEVPSAPEVAANIIKIADLGKGAQILKRLATNTKCEPVLFELAMRADHYIDEGLQDNARANPEVAGFLRTIAPAVEVADSARTGHRRFNERTEQLRVIATTTDGKWLTEQARQTSPAGEMARNRLNDFARAFENVSIPAMTVGRGIE